MAPLDLNLSMPRKLIFSFKSSVSRTYSLKASVLFCAAASCSFAMAMGSFRWTSPCSPAAPFLHHTSLLTIPHTLLAAAAKDGSSESNLLRLHSNPSDPLQANRNTTQTQQRTDPTAQLQPNRDTTQTQQQSNSCTLTASRQHSCNSE